jgi:NRPS condensation-like uncharacterized protein
VNFILIRLGGIEVSGNKASFPVEPQDVFNYLVDKYSANNQLSYILRINGRINEKILEQAIRLSIEIQPILGCHFIENDEVATWEQQSDLAEIELCTVVEALDVEGEVQKFIALRYDFDQDCQVKARIIRGKTDTVCVKVQHACADAGGLKEYLHILTSAYNHMVNEQSTCRELGCSHRRSQDSILQLPQIIEKINNMVTDSDNLGHTVGFPYSAGDNINQTFVIRKLTQQEFKGIKMQARKNHGTVNDVCLAAYSRALVKIAEIKNEMVSICFTSDLRTYLPPEEKKAIGNLSGMNLIRIHRDLAEPFNETVGKVITETKKVKANFPGINMALYFETLGKMNFKDVSSQFEKYSEDFSKTRFCNPWLSNVGILADTKIRLGAVEVEDCYMVGTASFSPGMLLLVSTYDDVLTLSVNFFQSTMEKKNVEEMLDAMITELSNWVGM